MVTDGVVAMVTDVKLGSLLGVQLLEGVELLHGELVVSVHNGWVHGGVWVGHGHVSRVCRHQGVLHQRHHLPIPAPPLSSILLISTLGGTASQDFILEARQRRLVFSCLSSHVIITTHVITDVRCHVTGDVIGAG